MVDLVNKTPKPDKGYGAKRVIRKIVWITVRIAAFAGDVVIILDYWRSLWSE